MMDGAMHGTLRAALLLLGFFVIDSRAADPIAGEPGPQPDHLIPVNPAKDLHYKDVTEKLLVTTGDDYGRMVMLPSLDPELAVSVHSAGYEGNTPRFCITFTKASRNFLQGPLQGDPGIALRPYEIIRKDAYIDRDFAVAVQRAWASLLLKTRYSRKYQIGLDGEMVRFSVNVDRLGELQGEIWSPDHGLPHELVGLAFDLADYCTVEPAQRPALRKTIMKKLEDFTRRAQ